MAIINIRGTSGSGKSTLVRRFLDENEHFPQLEKLGDWKTPKIVGYIVPAKRPRLLPTTVIGRYETQCGGCDSLSYKGSHEDIEKMVRSAAQIGNVIFEGLTISSTVTRWQKVSDDFPGQYVWAFMVTPEEECYRRILARSGREPKRDHRGEADYNKKFRGCNKHMREKREEGEQVLSLLSDDKGYEAMVRILE